VENTYRTSVVPLHEIKDINSYLITSNAKGVRCFNTLHSE